MKVRAVSANPEASASASAWLGRVRHVCVAIALLAGQVQAAPPWPDVPYSYFAESVPLETLLAEFASSFSLSLSLQPGVTGTVNGRFTTKGPSEFISRLGGVYGFSWYTHGGTLFVSKTSDAVMRSIVLPPGGYNLKGVLMELGVVDPRFGWAELPDQRVVMVSGPVSYIDLVEATLKRMPGSSSRQEVRVFRLRYASAEDRVINVRDRSISQPGLATVLQQLIGGRGAVTSGMQTEQLNPSSAVPTMPFAPLLSSAFGNGGSAASNTGGSTPVAEGAGAGAGSTALSSRGAASQGTTLQVNADPRFRVPSIQSDPRLNAIIVQDQPERMPVYEQLIAQLDVPSPLIEIEAMIIDINSERARELGINWSAQSRRATLDFGVGTGLSLAAQIGGSSTLIADSGLKLLAEVRALENNGDARVQSRPSVLTLDNVGALLDLSETFYVRVQGERVANVSPVTAGTTLKVTPRLIQSPTPSIQLTIDIEDGTIGDRQVDSLPTVKRSSLSTQAIVKTDETLLIAGYSSDHNIEAVQKVPGLGDLPGIGALFSNNVRTMQKRERFFMIRPKLIGFPFMAEPLVREGSKTQVDPTLTQTLTQ